MRVLAIDTALGACAAAVLDTASDGLLAQESLAMRRGHAESLMPLLARVMAAAGLSFFDLDRVVTTVGPGSFTGLRVGIAAARGIALAAEKPAVGISTLAAFAAPHLGPAATAPVVAAIDARHGHVYLQVFGPRGDIRVGPAILSLGEAAASTPGEAPRIVGTGARLVAAAWPASEPAPALVQAEEAPDIAWVARLGAAALPPEAPARPLYLRAPDAKPQDAARLPRR